MCFQPVGCSIQVALYKKTVLNASAILYFFAKAQKLAKIGACAAGVF
jgi:hypothetical protein